MSKLEMPIEDFAIAVSKENARLNAEIERLRAALYDIGYQASYIGLYSEGWARECARKALEAKG